MFVLRADLAIVVCSAQCWATEGGGCEGRKASKECKELYVVFTASAGLF